MKISVTNNDSFCWPNKHSKLTVSENGRSVVWMIPDRLFNNVAINAAILDELVAEFEELRA